MRRSEWGDSELIELLRQMPKIKDHRDPRDIYQNISLKKRKLKPWLLPGLAAAAALFLFFILVPKLMDGTNTSYDQAGQGNSTENNKSMKMADQNSPTAMKKEGASPVDDRSNKAVDKVETMRATSIKTAIYDGEAGNGKVLTYWIPDPQVQILVPVSIIVPDAKDKSWLTLFKENMANLREKEWGLTDFYPPNLKMELGEHNNIITVDVPKDHQYGQGAATEIVFRDVLNKDIASNSNIKKVKLTTNGEPGIELGNFGVLEDININDEQKHAFFLYFPKGSDLPLLTPSKDSYKNITSAFEAMKNDHPALGLKGSLGPLQPLSDISIIDKTLYVSFKGISELKDDQLTLSSFEALLLTAKEFDVEKVVVKDSPLIYIGSFDLSKENKVPMAPNLRTIE